MALTIFLVLDGILIVLVSVLALQYNKQINEYERLRRNYSTITVLQKIMEIFGEGVSSNERLEAINNVFLKDFNVMFSTVVSYSGGKHIIKVSNVESVYHDDFKELNETPMFKPNCEKNIPKYITSGTPGNLKYQTAIERGIRSVLLMPLYLQGTYAGYWILEDTRQNAFDRIDKIQLSILKNNLGLIIENSNYQSAIERMAINDKLTGMYNRNYLYTRGKALIEEHSHTIVTICDIDFFKKVNDSYGHDIGDKVLKTIAETTSKNLSKEDVFVRFGGEEFVILCPGQDMAACKEKVNKIRQIIEGTKVSITDDKSISVTMSYGMSIYKRGGDLDAAIKNSDVALYRAKQNGRNRVEIAEPV